MSIPSSSPSSLCEWRLFVCNAYQIAPLFVNKFNRTCKDHDGRAERLGRLIQREGADVVCLQEMWGGGQRALERALAAGSDDSSSAPRASQKLTEYRVPRSMQSWYGWSVVDTAAQYTARRGGLWYAEGDACCRDADAEATSWKSEYPRQHTFTVSNSKSKKGVMASKHTKITVGEGEGTAMGAPAGRSTIIVFNTHLDPTNANQTIEMQLGELTRFVRSVLTEEWKKTLTPQAATSPCEPTPHHEATVLPLSAVIVGDLNITPSSTIYKKFLATGTSTNVAPGQVQVTTGETDTGDGAGEGATPKCNGSAAGQATLIVGSYGVGMRVRELLPKEVRDIPTYAKENPLVAWPDAEGHLDHVFAIDAFAPLETSSTGALIRAPVPLIPAQTVRAAVLDDSRTDGIVSDHYPMVITIAVNAICERDAEALCFTGSQTIASHPC